MSVSRNANRSQSFLLPPSLDELVRPDDPARFLDELLSSMDLRARGFVDPPRHAPGQPAWSVELLLRIWVYGYFRKIRSLRQLERACAERIPLMWLTGMLCPDHNALHRFFKAHRAQLRSLARDVTRLAAHAGLVDMVLHALDGTKLRAVCSMDSALHRKRLLALLDQHGDAAVEEVFTQLEALYKAEHRTGETLPKDLAQPAARKQVIETALAELAAHDTQHLHPREPEARVMKGRLEARLQLDYNAQVVTDGEFVVAEDVSADETDHGQLTPMLDQALEVLGERPEATAVDAGYVSGRELALAETHHHELIVPPGSVEPPVPPADKPFDKAHFRYDADRDEYVCPLGTVLPLWRLTRSRKDEPEMKVYRCLNTACPERSRCTRDARLGRTVRHPIDRDALDRQASRQPPGSERRAAYSERKVLVERVFGLLKWNDGFRRFTVWGLESVRAQWSLVCTAFNLRALHRRWVRGEFALPAAA